ncbi:MAG: hypothetical protein KA765_11965 [Thermoflexales bacterium]|nr:hypothetical protein [Thermoflexales bacterium]
MRRNPERLAWTVLLVSLLICIGLTVAVPLSIRSFINDSTDVASITLEVQQGTVLVRRAGLDEPIGVTTGLANIPEGSSIRADENVQALLTIRATGDQTTLLTVQIYGSTNLGILRARSPRFTQSGLPHQVQLGVEGGRVRLSVAGALERPIECELVTPQATAQLQDGTYAVDVTNDEAQVTVREGSATVNAQGSSLALGPLQRTVVKLDSRPAGILSPERNLVINGNFRLPLDGTWETSHDLQQPTESPGDVTIVTDGSRRVALFQREGLYHAETALRQAINKDVRDFRALKLHFVVKVISHDVFVCGQAGSECPMMVRLDYKDDNGTDRSYLQGFYSQLDPNGVNPNYNTTSGARVEHIRVPRNFSFTYDSGDLMPTLKPSQITAITFYASGHSYSASIAEVELLGEQ